MRWGVVRRGGRWVFGFEREVERRRDCEVEERVVRVITVLGGIFVWS